MTVMWRTGNSVAGTVDYGETTSYGSTITSSAGNLHEVELTGLLPDTKYYYKVTSDGDIKTAWFRTYPASHDTPITFVVNGDFQSSNESYLRKVQGAVKEQIKYEPYFSLHVGDICLDGESLTSPTW